MNVFWLEQTESDLPANDDWLSRTEADLLSKLRFPKRRADWRLGRWTAKRALGVCLGLASDCATAATVEILPARSGQPEAFLRGERAPVSISLSHRAGIALCTIAPLDTALGCDLEVIEPHSEAFAADYFTAEEQLLVATIAARDRSLILTILWSAKESALKALRQGLRIDTRALTVELQPEREISNPWAPLQVHWDTGTDFHGFWSRSGDFIRTIVANVTLLTPVSLDSPSHGVSGAYADATSPRGPSHDGNTNSQ